MHLHVSCRSVQLVASRNNAFPYFFHLVDTHGAVQRVEPAEKKRTSVSNEFNSYISLRFDVILEIEGL